MFVLADETGSNPLKRAGDVALAVLRLDLLSRGNCIKYSFRAG
jgi:hypothetical protein